MSNINATGAYRLTGTAISISELAKNKPGMVVKATDEQIAEIKLHEEQVQARDAVNNRYAEQHPDKVYGQVVVDGKLFATVYDSGVATMPYQIPGLSNEGFGTELTQTRLAEIAKAANGEIIHSSFFPDAGISFRSAPESDLPPVTARSLIDFTRELSWARERSRMEAMEQRVQGQDSPLGETKVK
ncbi:hypothetical protein D3870_13950 [Noviherbaspirillum cavernae]|uniref:Uncharacterized protein n=1 Tax=Noviherbaspirillum cavernae TaxID=2320862 RepID=A0A418X3C0_9BURK|nr:hypothetical protein [Noviherbaspirillum cavernae]RJG06954.1 hypothetical protein D3870_13950 [Noviherbaspirillum cavernae]